MKSQMRRLQSVGLAVALGVSFLMAVLTFTDSLWHTVERDLDGSFSGYDYVAQQPFPPGQGGLDEELAEQIREVPGVDGVTPSISTAAFVERGILQDPVQVRSLEWLPPGAELLEGSQPGTGEVLLDAAVARNLGFSPGDSLRILETVVDTEYAEVEVSGLVDAPPVVPAPEAQNVLYGSVPTLGEVVSFDSGEYSQLFIEASAPEGPAAELDALAAADPERDYAVVDAEQFVSDRARADLPGASQVVTGTVAVSALAFVVLLLVIRSVFAVRIERDRREFSLRRCLGASRGRIFRSVLLDALAVGAVSSLIGVALAVAVLAGVFRLPMVPLEFRAGLPSAAIAVAAGVVVCVIGAVGPAAQAMRSSPLGALRDSAETGKAHGAGRFVPLKLGVLVLGLSGLGLSAFTGLLPGAILASAVLALALLWLVRPATVAATRLLDRLPWLRRRIAAEEGVELAGANPRRSASIVGLATVTAAFVGLVGAGSSTVFTSVEKVFEDSPAPDVYITIDDEQSSAAAILEKAEGVGSVEEAAVIDIAGLDVDGSADAPHQALEGGRAVAADADTARVLSEPGHLEQVEPGTALLGEVFGFPDGEELTFVNGDRSLQVEAMVREAGTNYAFLDPGDFASFTSEGDTQEVWLSYSEGVSEEQASSDLATALSGEGVSFESSAQYKAELDTYVGLIGALSFLLLSVGVLIALVGISNTLRVSVLERRQEIGLQRALGASRSTVRGALVVETLLLTLLGCLLGLAAGGLVAVTGVYTYAESTPLFRFGSDLPVGLFAMTLLGTAVVGGAAALVAARHAVNVPPVAAITRD